MYADTSPLWEGMIGGSISIMATASVLRGGEVILEDLPVGGGSITKTTDGKQIQQTLSLTTNDETGELQSGPLAPLMPLGQQVVVRAGLADKADSPTIIEMLPMGVFGIDKPAPQSKVPQKLYPNGKWVSTGGLIEIAGSDPLAQLGREPFINAESPPLSATVRSETERLLLDRLPVASAWAAGVTDTAAVSRTVTYDSSRLSTILNLAQMAGGVGWVNRVGAYQLLRQVRQSEGAWRLTVADPDNPADQGALVTWVPDMDRENFHNGVIINSEDVFGKPLRGVKYETTGPLAWGGPFGEVPLIEDNRLATSNASAQAIAEDRYLQEIDGRSITVTVECLPNYALDPLDTIELGFPNRSIMGLITSIVYPLSPATMTLQVSIPFVDWVIS